MANQVNRSYLSESHPQSSPSIQWTLPEFGYNNYSSSSSGFDDPAASIGGLSPSSEYPSSFILNSSLDSNSSIAFNVSTTEKSAGNEEPEYTIIDNKAVQASFCILYTAIFILGIFGNFLVCYVVGRNRAMQTVTNMFITNLALSDILLCILAVPFTPLYTFHRRWVFGKTMCHLVPYAQGTSVYVSTLTLSSIAVDRFFVIIHPFRPRMKMATCIAVIVGIWAFSLIVTFPYGLYTTEYFHTDRLYCSERWPYEWFRQLYGGLTTSMQFIIPFIIITYCYVRVSLRLNDRARCKPGNSSVIKKSTRREEIDRERKKRTNRMLIAMVTIFGVSWLPINLLNLMNDLFISVSGWTFFDLCFFTVHAVAMSSTCYNPFLYAWLNENFRKEFKQVLPCFGPASGAASNTEMTGAMVVRTGGGQKGSDGGGGHGGGGKSWKRRSERGCNEVSTVQETLLPPSVANSQPGSRRCSMGTSSRGMQSVVTTATQVDESPVEEEEGPLVQYTVEREAVELRLKEIGGQDDEEEENKNGVVLGVAVGDSRIGDLV